MESFACFDVVDDSGVEVVDDRGEKSFACSSVAYESAVAADEHSAWSDVVFDIFVPRVDARGAHCYSAGNQDDVDFPAERPGPN